MAVPASGGRSQSYGTQYSGPDTRWAEVVREEFAAFPFGDADNFVDSSTIALTRFRHGGFIPMQTDEEDEPVHRKSYSPY